MPYKFAILFALFLAFFQIAPTAIAGSTGTDIYTSPIFSILPVADKILFFADNNTNSDLYAMLLVYDPRHLDNANLNLNANITTTPTKAVALTIIDETRLTNYLDFFKHSGVHFPMSTSGQFDGMRYWPFGNKTLARNSITLVDGFFRLQQAKTHFWNGADKRPWKLFVSPREKIFLTDKEVNSANVLLHGILDQITSSHLISSLVDFELEQRIMTFPSIKSDSEFMTSVLNLTTSAKALTSMTMHLAAPPSWDQTDAQSQKMKSLFSSLQSSLKSFTLSVTPPTISMHVPASKNLENDDATITPFTAKLSEKELTALEANFFLQNALLPLLVPQPILKAVHDSGHMKMLKSIAMLDGLNKDETSVREISITYPNAQNSVLLLCSPSLDSFTLNLDYLSRLWASQFAFCMRLRREIPDAFRPIKILHIHMGHNRLFNTDPQYFPTVEMTTIQYASKETQQWYAMVTEALLETADSPAFTELTSLRLPLMEAIDVAHASFMAFLTKVGPTLESLWVQFVHPKIVDMGIAPSMTWSQGAWKLLLNILTSEHKLKKSTISASRFPNLKELALIGVPLDINFTMAWRRFCDSPSAKKLEKLVFAGAMYQFPLSVLNVAYDRAKGVMRRDLLDRETRADLWDVMMNTLIGVANLPRLKEWSFPDKLLDTPFEDWTTLLSVTWGLRKWKSFNGWSSPEEFEQFCNGKKTETSYSLFSISPDLSSSSSSSSSPQPGLPRSSSDGSGNWQSKLSSSSLSSSSSASSLMRSISFVEMDNSFELPKGPLTTVAEEVGSEAGLSV